MIFSIKPQIFELKCVFSYFRLKTHITLLLPVYVHSWEQRKFGEVFDCTVPNNTLSRAELSYDEGTVLNVHYGDVLIKYGSVLDVQKDDIPRIPHRCREDFNGALLQDGDVIIADTAEDETTGKACEIGNLQGSAIVSGLHTMVCRPRNRMALGYLGYYLNSNAYHHQLLPLMQGIKVLSLSRSNIQKTSVSYPSAMKEQQLIASYFSQLDHLITLHQCKCQIDGCRFQSPLAITWEQRKVREVTDRYDNLRIPVAASLRVAGTTPYYGANGIQDYVDGYTHDGEFILVAEDGANDLKNYPVKCVKGRIWVNNHAHVLQGKYDCADNQFLAYAISQADIESLLVGGGRAKLNAETLMGIDLLLPNKAEQIRIGKYLAQLDNLITLHQRKYDKLTNVKKSMLEKMFPQNGSNVPEIRFKGFTEAWEQRKLSEIATMHARIGWQNLRTSEFLDSGDYMLITGTDFIDGAVNFDTCHYVERERYEQDKHIQIRNGSILITKDGTLGKVAYIQGLTMPATLNAGVFNVEIKDENEVDNRYLFQYLKAPFLMDYVDKKATGGTIKHLNQNILVDFPVVLPHKAEQEKIGEYFLAIDHLITLHQRKPVVVNSSSTMNALPNQHLYFQVLE